MSANPLQESRERERQSKFAPRRDLLFIVSRDALDHYEHLKQVFADDKSVTVILDRRWGERPKTSSARDAEPHRADRRSRLLLDDRLRRQGWAMAGRLSVDTPQTGINSSTVKESNPMIPGPR